VSETGEVLVAGAGIGGLTAALALQREGVPFRVFEQARELREVGAGVSLWPNAMRVFRRLGLHDEVKGHRVPLERIVLFRTDGTEILRLREPGRYPEPALCLHRAKLQELLLARVPEDRVHTGRRVAGFQVQGAGVKVDLEDGEAAEGSLLVGCDGIHSAVRSQLHGTAPPVYRGYEIWRGVSDLELPPDLVGQATEWWGPGRRFGLLPGAPGRVYWYGTRSRSSSGEAEGSDTDLAGLSRLRTAFVGWPSPVEDIVQGAGEKVVRTEAADRPVPRRWGRGPVTLLGDAAHPMTPNMGQGSCAAIEDALILARCMGEQGVGPQALRRYEKLRRRRTRWIVHLSRHIGRLGQLRSPLAAAGRDRLLGLLPTWPVEKGQERIYGYPLP
jgi:2-polyprenyl-6-methoxyphenol hydroxylase-like FAD-dependent oxidoreductase